MSQTILEKDITKTLGLDSLSDEQQAAFLSNVGSIVLESSLLHLVESFDEQQQESLQYYLDTNPTPDALMEHLLKHYKKFEKILEEEIISFKEDALTVLGEKEV